jgi:PTH1 family peptidyl-tRNA hydrolase
MEAIAAEKSKLIAALPKHGTAILNADDAKVLAMQAQCVGHVLTYGLGPEAMVRAVNVRCRWPERLSFTVLYGDQSQFVQTQLCATHLVSCVLAALAVGVAMGIPLAIGAQAVERVQPYPGRMYPVSLPGGATVIRDDIKAPLWTIPSVLKFMEEAEAKRKIVVLGTISDLPLTQSGKTRREYAEVARQALDVADYVFFVGPWASKALQAKQNPADDRLRAFSNVQAVTQFLNDFLQPEDLVLIKGSSHTDHLDKIVLKLKKQDVGKTVVAKPQFSDARNLQHIPSVTSSTGHTIAQSNNDNPLGASPQLLSAEGLNRVQVLVGLGNPEKKYQDTPHNVGQKAIDKVLLLMAGEWTQEHDWMMARVEWRGNTIYLVKPKTAMNRIGPLLFPLVQRLGLTPSQVILVQDDLNLPLGTVRLRMKGSSGGHKGVGSIIDAFQTEMFRRLKIGVGQLPQNMTAPEYVLQPFALPAQSVIERACVEAADRLLELVASFRAAPPVEETLQRNTGQQENFTGLT